MTKWVLPSYYIDITDLKSYSCHIVVRHRNTCTLFYMYECRHKINASINLLFSVLINSGGESSEATIAYGLTMACSGPDDTPPLPL